MKGVNRFFKRSLVRLRSKVIFRQLQGNLLVFCNIIIPFLLLVSVGLVIYDFGFKPFWRNSSTVNFWFQILLDVLTILMAVRLLLDLSIKRKKWVRFFTIAGWFFILFLTAYVHPVKSSITNYTSNEFLFLKLLLYVGITSAFITELSHLVQVFYIRSVNPAVLFVISYVIIILLGALLLKLPNATNGGITAIDALFTSTSAVCITGLIVVDTATHFTTFGHLILLALFQVGGLGIMTFAGLLAYAVAGQSSFKSQLAFKDMMSGREIKNIMNFISQVVLVTFFFEFLGTAFIFFSLEDALFDRRLDKLFFSFFHAVSAFCNAGFSTYTNGLYELPIRFNYSVHFFVAILVILGGLGFPIVFNIFRYLKVKTTNRVRQLFGNSKREHFPKLISLNSRLALVMTFWLLFIGFIVYFIFEQGNTLSQHPGLGGKLMTSFFGSVTPRSSGFATVDLSALSMPTIMLYLLLMWIGASPASTGGGIRTTTTAIAILNMIAVLRGKDRSEFFKSEISHDSVRRAFAIILISVFFIGIYIFLISINDSDKGLLKIAFEVFSAFSTVGLSLGITPELTGVSKFVVILAMFTGRVGMITILVVFIRQSKQLHYRYPKEDVAF
jgi:potassium uptake TrkH family protein